MRQPIEIFETQNWKLYLDQSLESLIKQNVLETRKMNESISSGVLKFSIALKGCIFFY